MNTLPFKRINDEVFIAVDDIVRFDVRAIEFIKTKALENARGRARICAHRNSTDSLHEMLIAIQENSYIRPHRHHNKIESFHLIEGEADILIFNEEGVINDIVRLSKENNFYYRLNTPQYHTLLIYSSLLVIHEVTNGPFDANTSDFAAFSPDENEKAQIDYYIESLKKQVISFYISQ